jgi:plastocyanin
MPLRSWVVTVFGALALLGGDARAAVKGTLTLPEVLRVPRDDTTGYWRLENGVVPIGPPVRSAYHDVLVVFESSMAATPVNATATVEITGLDFQPRVLPVQVGTTVEFKNLDRYAHVLWSPENASFFKQEPTAPGTSRKVRFFAPGAVVIRCMEFPHMEGAVIVLPLPYYARPDDKGGFSATVPDGRYTLRVFARGRWVHQQPVEVGPTTELKIRVAPPKERE